MGPGFAMDHRLPLPRTFRPIDGPRQLR